MLIYEDETKTIILNPEDINHEKGYLKDFTEIVHHDAIEAVEEQGHYETIAEYENGGKDVEWIVDVEGVEAQEAWDETIVYYIYYPYTDVELRLMEIEREIHSLQNELSNTDYKAIKFSEGWYTEEEYAPTKKLRQLYRTEINTLEQEREQLTQAE